MVGNTEYRQQQDGDVSSVESKTRRIERVQIFSTVKLMKNARDYTDLNMVQCQCRFSESTFLFLL